MIDLNNPRSPTHIFDEKTFEKNLVELKSLKDRCGLRILLALKGYNPLHSADLVNQYLDGIAASSVYEARSSSEHYTGQKHIYCPAYDEDSFDELMSYGTHVVFNSRQDLARFAPRVPAQVKIDLRLNIEYRQHETPIFSGYDPNLPHSRFGITTSQFKTEDIETYNVSGIHFHALNSQGANDLQGCVDTLEQKFPGVLDRVERINMGGGHLVCNNEYDYGLVEEIVTRLQQNYGVEVFIEPSEHVFAGVGILKARVLSLTKNQMPIAILNVSAKNHMPDILESPSYNVAIEEGQFGKGTDKHSYILTGNTCLSCDVIGEYSFPQELQLDDTITFLEQTSYTLVQSHYFNGIGQPDLVVIDKWGKIKMYRKDKYEQYLSEVYCVPLQRLMDRLG